MKIMEKSKILGVKIMEKGKILGLKTLQEVPEQRQRGGRARPAV